MEAFRQNPFRSIVSWSAVQDWFANLLAHGLFQRFPNLRMASIETGSDWVFHLFDKLKKSFGADAARATRRTPRETFGRHVWVSPYYEDDLGELRDLARRRPHAHGLRLPARRGPRRAERRTSRTSTTSASPPEDSRLVMRDNGLALSRRRPA